MRTLFNLIFLLFIVLCAGAIIILFKIIDDAPEIRGVARLSAAELRQAQVFIQNRDPRNLEPGEISAFTIEEQDLALLINYALSELRGGGAILNLSEGQADMIISAAIPQTPLGGYVNVDMSVSQWGREIGIERLRIGTLGIPRWLADWVLRRVHTELQRYPEYVAAMEAINGYSISDNRINVIYQWQPELVAQISSRGRDVLVSEADQERIMAHARNLAAVTNDPGLGRVVSLADIMGPMFQFARLRQGDPVEENRAAILVMAMYIMGVSPAKVLGQSENLIPVMGKHKLTLSERHDFAQHFLVSAGLTVSTGTGIADTIGLLKEMDDADGGSGFSFTDIGADRTGVRLAEMAITSQQRAEAVQDLLDIGVSEQDFMAEFRDLPEFLPQETFAGIYGEVDSPAYRLVIEDIENRIAATPFFRTLDSM